MTSSITLIPAKPEDIDYFYATRKEGMEPHMKKIGRVWDENYERQYNSKRFNNQLPYLRMIHANGERVGFISVRPDANDAVWLESFCIERRHQARTGISETVIRHILQEPEFQNKRFRAEIMKGYPSRQLAEKAGFCLIDDSGELDILERPAVTSLQPRKPAHIP